LWDDVLGLAIQAGGAGHTLFSGMHHAIAALAQQGNNVLADHVLVEPSWVLECARLFADFPAYLIGLRCPLEVLEKRERKRKDRTLGQARLQYQAVHAFTRYDLEVNTSLLPPLECAGQIIARLHAGPPEALSSLRLNLLEAG
jgi:chloramphenicol 3-O phosphotransferase